MAHVPPGWAEWLGLVGNSQYYNYTLSANGKPERHGDSYAVDYLTTLLSNRTARFLRNRWAAQAPLAPLHLIQARLERRLQPCQIL